MEITLRFLGLELLHIAASTDEPACEDYDEGGDAMTYPLGFVASHELPDELGLRQEWGE